MSTKPKVTPKPKATFAAASFAALRAAAGESQGEALRILLADIDEDPDQPRTNFDADELEAMAASIREHGVVQPITVRPPVDGRYTLVFGARRVRASRLAGKADIPAVIRAPSPADFAAQIIENQQRANLSNSDLAAAIARLADDGHTNKQIGAICSLKDYQVAAFRQAGNFPPELRERIDNADMRALYDLYRQWTKTPAEVVATLPDGETYITVTEARRITGAITGRPTGSIVLDRLLPPNAPASHPASASGADGKREELPDAPQPALGRSGRSANAAPAGKRGAKATPSLKEPAGATEPVFIVKARNGRLGRLVVDQRAERTGCALVAYDEGIEEVEAATLRIVAIE